MFGLRRKSRRFRDGCTQTHTQQQPQEGDFRAPMTQKQKAAGRVLVLSHDDAFYSSLAIDHRRWEI